MPNEMHYNFGFDDFGQRTSVFHNAVLRLMLNRWDF